MFKSENFVCARDVGIYNFLLKYVDYLLSIDEFNHISISSKDDPLENSTDIGVGWSIELSFMDIFKIKLKIYSSTQIRIYQASYDAEYTDNSMTFLYDIASDTYIGILFYLIENESYCFFSARPYNSSNTFYNYSYNFGTFCVKKNSRKFYSYYTSYKRSLLYNEYYLNEGVVDYDTKKIYAFYTTFDSNIIRTRSDKILYRNKLLLDLYNRSFELQCDEILDVPYVTIGNHFSINDHKYFSINNYTLLKYD